jgi:hypothetical protein
VRGAVLADLVRRDQIADWELTPALAGFDPDDVRAVLAELVNPSFDLRTVDGIAAATHLDAATVRNMLKACEAAEGRPYQVWRGGEHFALETRKPGLLKRLPGIGAAANWWDKPAVN